MEYDKKEKMLYITHEEEESPELYWDDEEGVVYTMKYGPIPYNRVVFVDEDGK